MVSDNEKFLANILLRLCAKAHWSLFDPNEITRLRDLSKGIDKEDDANLCPRCDGSLETICESPLEKSCDTCEYQEG